MIGKRQQVDAVGMGAAHHGGGRQRAVRGGGVAVQIGIECVHDSLDNKKASTIRATWPG